MALLSPLASGSGRLFRLQCVALKLTTSTAPPPRSACLLLLLLLLSPFAPLADLDTRELVSSWLLVTSTAAPVVTKTYDIQLAVGTESHKKIAYANQWDQARVFTLYASDEHKMRVRYARMEIAAHATGFIKLWFAAASQPGAEELFVFVNDADDQNEECLLLRAQYV